MIHAEIADYGPARAAIAVTSINRRPARLGAIVAARDQPMTAWSVAVFLAGPSVSSGWRP